MTIDFTCKIKIHILFTPLIIRDSIKEGRGSVIYISWTAAVRRVSKCHGHTVVRPRKNFQTLRKILRFVCADLKLMHFNHFYSFFFMFQTYYVISVLIFFNFLAQNFKTKNTDSAKKSTFKMSGCTFNSFFLG